MQILQIRDSAGSRRGEETKGNKVERWESDAVPQDPTRAFERMHLQDMRRTAPSTGLREERAL
jgi:hypothetical protein